MSLMTLGMLLFLGGIGVATFLESLHGIQAAKILVYNALWFEILLLYLCLSLIANIFKYRMWMREKIAMLTFHLAFIVLIIGAAVTRYTGFEGIMVVPEGASIDYIYSGDPQLLVYVNDLESGAEKTFTKKKYFSEITPRHNAFDYTFTFEENNVAIKYVDFKAKRKKEIVSSPEINSSGIELFTNGRQAVSLFEGEVTNIGEIPLTFNTPLEIPGIEIRDLGDSLMLTSAVEMSAVKMSELSIEEQRTGIQDSSKIKQIATNQSVRIFPRTLYRVGNEQFVFNRILKNSKRGLVSTGNLKEGLDYLSVELSYKGASKQVTLEGGMGNIPSPEKFELNGALFQLEYGAIRKSIPFSILCKDFQLDNYPGSQAPSSFASEIQVNDPENNSVFDQRIFMNNVMDYQGFRFFQSSYKLDDPNTPENEEATILQVNNDFWGTNISYFGYLMMAIAMILSLFAPVGRFKLLNEQLKGLKERRKQLINSSKIVVSLIMTSILASGAQAQMNDHSANLADFSKHHQIISLEHSDKVARLLVQEIKYNHKAHQFSPTGRIIPFHTLADRLIRKLHRSTSYESLNGVQLILSMHLYPQYWAKQEVVQVPRAVREKLGLDAYASLEAMTADKGGFKWMDEYRVAHQKLESKRSEFEKKLIKLNEKYEVLRGVFSWDYFQISPLFENQKSPWTQPRRIFENSINPYVLDTTYFALNLEEFYRANDTSNYVLFSEMYDALYPDKNINAILASPPNALFVDIVHFSPIQKAIMNQNYDEARILLTKYADFLKGFVMVSSENVSTITQQLDYLFIELDKACQNDDFSIADERIDEIIERQRSLASEIAPSEREVTLEIWYNKLEIFKNTAYAYGLLGFLSLLVFFIGLFSKDQSKLSKTLRLINKVFLGLLLLFFLFHGFGIGMRWYLSGHAPWSNGYEALVFIAWITMIAGISFSRKNLAVLPATAILAFFMLFVTEQNLMDPEITPLVPVLQSYWLMIHVAIITGSYGFLGLGAILGLINLLLFIFKKKSNKELMDINIHELTYISEMTITIGLFMLTIGTFLGGVWANESWGRYWGWDPKETWALVSILVYAILLHLRFIPKLNDKLTFNLFSFWAYSAILFTFFGVNFMLVGLHSYAQGDGLGNMPSWLLKTIFIFYLISEIAAVRHQVAKKNYTFSWKRTSIALAIKASIVLAIFMIIYLVFYTDIQSSEPLSNYVFSAFKFSEYLVFVLLSIVATTLLLLPISMGLLKRK